MGQCEILDTASIWCRQGLGSMVLLWYCTIQAATGVSDPLFFYLTGVNDHLHFLTLIPLIKLTYFWAVLLSARASCFTVGTVLSPHPAPTSRDVRFNFHQPAWTGLRNLGLSQPNWDVQAPYLYQDNKIAFFDSKVL